MATDFIPSYFRLAESGELEARIQTTRQILSQCTLCPHQCKVNRFEKEKGFCRSGYLPEVSSYNAHFGEEPVLVGSGGSGTIFFTNCTLHCVFCQNYPISQLGNGSVCNIEELAGMYLALQKRGCHNINFVTPTHFIVPILEALSIAIERGFNLPLVYNTSGYEQVETIRLVENVFDIYMPDIKYASNEMAKKYSGVSDYVGNNRASLKEMYRQVGILTCDKRGVAQRGMLVRHLVLPNNSAGSEDCLQFLEKELSPRIHLALMSQYFPAYKAPETPPLDRRVDRESYLKLTALVDKIGFQGWVQPI